MSQPRLDGDSSGKRQRSRQVCTGCRQNKLRCDATKMFPSSCSRCTAASLICRIDPEFRRTRKRGHSDPASPQEQSPGTLGQSASDFAKAPTFNPPALNLPPAYLPSPTLGTPQPPYTSLPLHSSHVKQAVQAPPSEYALGQVRASHEVVEVLFAEFFEFYHPHCPLFVTSRSPAMLHSTDFLLFWVVLYVASRRPILQPSSHEPFQLIPHVILANEVKLLVSAVLVDPSQRSLGSIQALLLLCHWPLPAASMKQDVSSMYSALASTMAIQLGMHRPLHSHEYQSRRPIDPSSEEGQERRIAWHTCHIVAYGVAVDHGHPSQVQDDWVNTNAATSAPTSFPALPLRLVQLLRLARFSDRVARALGGCSDTASGVPPPATSSALLRSFSSELTDLERSLGSVGDDISLVALLTRVRLCAYGLQMDSGPQTNVGARSQLASECYVGCVRTLDIVLRADPVVLGKWPQSMLWGFGQACITLISLVTGPDARRFDTPAALMKISEAFRVSQMLAVENGDLLSRFANYLGYAARSAHEKLGQGGPSSSKVKDKDAAGGAATTVSRYGIPNWTYDVVGQAKAMESRVRQEQEAAMPQAPPVSNSIEALSSAQSYNRELREDDTSNPAFEMSQQPNVYSQDQFNDVLSAFWNHSQVVDPLFGQQSY